MLFRPRTVCIVLLLGIDTSTSCGTVALASELGLVAEYNLNIERTHSARLLPILKGMLGYTGLSLSRIDLVAVAQGPGSFTGLRIGIAAAKALAFALNKPIVGIPTLDVLAHNTPQCRLSICAALDARKSEVFAAFYRSNPDNPGAGLSRLSDYLCVTPEGLAERIVTPVLLLGDGVVRYGDIVRRRSGSGLVFFAPSELNYPRASVLCRLAFEKWCQEGGLHPRDLRPLYVRPSDAELNRLRHS